jgi:DNA-binding transcriptional LysR family regulator
VFLKAVARHLRFAKTAETWHASAPAITLQIKDLKAEMGMPLFAHQGRKVSLPSSGE